MRNRPWLAWTGGQLLAFVGLVLLVDVGIGVVFSGHGSTAMAVGRIINIALAAGGLYVVFSWARNRDRTPDAKP
jgi:hypothetical protein